MNREGVGLLPVGPDDTRYRRLDVGGVSVERHGSHRFVVVAPETLEAVAREAVQDVSHLLRTDHLASLRGIVDDPEASDNDRYVATELLRNACIAAAGVLPMCQDTGTAIVLGKRGRFVLTDGNDAAHLARGIGAAYQALNLRYSQLAPLTMYDEVNTGDNLPAQIEIAAEGDDEYDLLVIAKGGGSANKSMLFQQTKALLNPAALIEFLTEQVAAIGTSACPPYHLAIVIGGPSAEFALKTAKLASTRELDRLPTTGSPAGHGFRDLELERSVLAMTQQLGIGAQFGGKYFCHDVRAVRLPRHGGSCPVAIAVSCSADRQVRAKITAEGVFLERLEADPSRFLPEGAGAELTAETVRIDLDRPPDEVRASLSALAVGTRLLLSGHLVVARDIAHARFGAALDVGEPLPDYLFRHPVYYAGPAKTPDGMVSGSFGPTTAGRMDPYLLRLHEAGASLVTLAKGNRSPEVAASCKRYGGFYLGSVGGPAARLAQDCVVSSSMVDHAEDGMEAVHLIEVVDFPAFVVIDDRGNDFYARPRPAVLKIGGRRGDDVRLKAGDALS